MSDFTRSREIVRTLLLSQHKRPHRISRVTDARILRTRVWVESVLSDNHLCRRELQSAFFGEERESTGTVLRWLKGKQTVSESTVENICKIPRIRDHNLEVFQSPVFQLLDKNLRKTELLSLINKYQIPTNIGYTWSFTSTEKFPIDNDCRYLIYAIEDSDALFQLGGVHGFMGIIMLTRLAEFNNESTKHCLFMRDAYRAFPAFCRNRYFKKRWKDFLILLLDIQNHVYTTSQIIGPNIEIIKKQIFAKHHPTIRHKWPRSPIDYRFMEPEKPYVTASLPALSMTSKTTLFKHEKRLF